MTNWTKPSLQSKYTEFITELKYRDNVVGSLYSTDVTVTGLPADNSTDWGVRSIRWNATNKYFERRNSSNNGWERLEGDSGVHKFVNLEAGTITGSGTVSGTTITASGQVQGARINVTGTTKPANGLYRPATNEIRFTTASTDRLTIESTGEVGINNVNPAYTLDVVGTMRMHNGSSSSRLEIGTGGTGSSRSAYIDLVGDTEYTDYGLRIIRGNGGQNTSSTISHHGTGALIFETVEAAAMYFQTTNTTRMIIDSGGNICIGDDSSPDDRLHIKQATNNAVYLRIQNNDGYARFGTDANDSYIDADVQRFRNRAGNADLMRLTSTGLGIGTTSFSHKLHVQGTAKITGVLTCDSTIVGTINKAEQLKTARNIGGVSFNGTTNINLPGVNTSGNQDTTGNAATATNASKLGGLSLSTSGDRWNRIPYVDSSGAIEIGEYLDFHGSDGSTANHENRIRSLGSTGFSFDAHLIPDGSSRDLGSTDNRWRNLYVNDLQMSNKGKQNDVDGTWGDYTIQEGEDSLFIKNNRNGKVYKLNWTEVEM